MQLDLDASLDQAPDDTAPATNGQDPAAAAAAASPQAGGGVTVSAYKKAIAVSGETRPLKGLLKEHSPSLLTLLIWCAVCGVKR